VARQRLNKALLTIHRLSIVQMPHLSRNRGNSGHGIPTEDSTITIVMEEKAEVMAWRDPDATM
jgi:hypothetical protein